MRVLILVVSAMLAACGGEDQSVMTADFSTMDRCVTRMEGVSGPLNITTDNENSVSGRLANGKAFGCRVMESGTKGRYIEGFYQP